MAGGWRVEPAVESGTWAGGSTIKDLSQGSSDGSVRIAKAILIHQGLQYLYYNEMSINSTETNASTMHYMLQTVDRDETCFKIKIEETAH